MNFCSFLNSPSLTLGNFNSDSCNDLISPTPCLWGPNTDPTNFSYTVQFGLKECRVPVVCCHFLYKDEAMQTVQLDLKCFFAIWRLSEKQHLWVEDHTLAGLKLYPKNLLLTTHYTAGLQTQLIGVENSHKICQFFRFVESIFGLAANFNITQPLLRILSPAGPKLDPLKSVEDIDASCRREEA